ncbi:hypothetical protein TIFTF001_005901 [Ficus carica]|uniref:Uncharacterized protein n=1 Tax=Ficus carica TaxID=3494 RepID=A0AA88CVE1_FICCA|nr:hypothetical protein TIFTF001_005901 [Ficus carica]
MAAEQIERLLFCSAQIRSDRSITLFLIGASVLLHLENEEVRLRRFQRDSEFRFSVSFASLYASMLVGNYDRYILIDAGVMFPEQAFSIPNA